MKPIETVNGLLSKLSDNKWVVCSPYGNFPLSPQLITLIEKKEVFQDEGEVEAVVQYGMVTEYHFCNPFKDK